MIELNDEYYRLDELMFEKFGSGIPMREIPTNVDNDLVIRLAKQSLEEGKDLLAEYFGYANDDQDLYY